MPSSVVTRPHADSVDGDLLDLPRLHEAAIALAERLSTTRNGASWWARLRRPRHTRLLRQDLHLLTVVYREAAEDVHRGDAISPAAEWLLDNFHLVSAEAHNARHDLPAGYYHRLPRRARPAADTRIETLAREVIRHSDGRLDAERLQSFLIAFQTAAPLTIGELWAWPTVLKMTLVGHLATLAARVRAARDAVRMADGHVAASLSKEAASRAFPVDPSMAFVVRLLQRVREYGPLAADIHRQVEEWLAARDMTPEDAIRIEGQREAADQASMGNAITSLRLCGSLDWSGFFERVSQVEQILRRDPAGVYSRMDFLSRDQYRRAVEELAGDSSDEQVRVALASVEAARSTPPPETEGRSNHVGHWLVGEGVSALERTCEAKTSWRRCIRRALKRRATPLYLLAIAGITAALTAAAVAYAFANAAPLATLWAVGLLTLLPASQLAIALVNDALTRWLPPRRVLRMDLDGGVPAPGRTMVVVPTIFASVSAVEEMLAHVEVQALGNVDERIHFAVLSDFADADAEHMPDDAAILDAASDGIDALNRRHGAGRSDRFYLFHRARLWNASEGRWIGWERKRGKVEEFLRLLRHDTQTSFIETVGDLDILPEVNYCISLDGDTRLPRDAAKALIGVAMHPLNRPHVDAETRIVTAGYGIVQPRVSVTMASAAGSLFARVYAGHTGVDPYSTAVSDVYQDLFADAVFTGKGLIQVDAFLQVLEDRVPDNALLSHDLFEGVHARVALASDIEVVDDYPPGVLAHARRQRRWVRGDWQVLLWLLPWVPTREGWEKNPLSTLSKWKILDNLRRSIVAPTLVALLISGWTWLPGSAAIWTLAALLVLGAPLLLVVRRLLALPWTRPLGVAVRQLWDDARTTVAQVLLSTVLLAYHAWDMVHAIVVTLVRLFITHRRLLEWETAASAAARMSGLSGRHGVYTFEMEMASSTVIAVLALASIAQKPPTVWLCAAPFIIGWVSAPAIAYWLSRPVSPLPEELDARDRRQLRLWARQTWRYFETQMGPSNHWLPPDNIQESPSVQVAHRTSPTNIGMGLLATLGAHDLGYLTSVELLERIEKVLDSLEAMDRHEGHWLNWYETTSLEPLLPRYVSTVDSGNLAAALVTVAAGLDGIAVEPQRAASLVDGLRDTASCLASSGEQQHDSQTAGNVPWYGRTVALAVLDDLLPGSGDLPLDTLRAWRDALRAVPVPVEIGVRDDARAVPDPARGNQQTATESDAKSETWEKLLEHQLSACLERGQPDSALASRLVQVADRCRGLAAGMRFDFLYSRSRHLFVIGYRLADAGGPGELDSTFYDLLASEARLSSFWAIATGQVPQRHWFHLGRSAVSVDGVPTLLSWSASMFEYLMPTLVMRVAPNTMLESTCRQAVRRQIEYGRQRGVPWGISESAFNIRDRNGTYQYKAFGVPGLGLKRGLADDLVIAPYATVLALRFEPRAAMRNLARLVREGAVGRFGFFDALDYTRRKRGDEDSKVVDSDIVVRTFMAHHEGMSLVAMVNALRDDVMVRRFHSDPRVQATELLLQERIPRAAAAEPPRPVEETRTTPAPVPLRRFRTPHTQVPHTQFLSNGTYVTAVTNAGGGFSRWRDLSVTRWREDPTADWTGHCLYLRDVRSGDLWSATYQPTCREPDAYVVTFAPDRVVFRRSDHAIEAQLDIAVSPEDDTEVRRLSLTNHSVRPRELEVTSYAEVVLDHQDIDLAHPVFSRLFVETEFLPDAAAILCGRRQRRPEDVAPWLFHAVSIEGPLQGVTEYESSRERFVGRGRSLADPAALDGRPLSGTVGAVLDPIVSLRQRIRLAPGAFVRLSFVTGVAPDRASAQSLAQRYHYRAAAARAFAMARTHHHAGLRHLGMTLEHARLFDRLASRVFGLDNSLRADADTIRRNVLGLPGLWVHGISGDLPIVVVKVFGVDELGLVRQILAAHDYWRLQGLRADIVVVNEHPASYLDEMHAQLMTLLERGPSGQRREGVGGVYVLRGDHLTDVQRGALESAARVVVAGTQGELPRQLDRPPPPLAMPRSDRPRRAIAAGPTARPEIPLLMANGLGGFSVDGREYVITLAEGRPTPAPWANVLANATFGTLITASGCAFTWSENSRENRLTPFANDPVGEPTAEAILLRDDDDQTCWAAVPQFLGDDIGYSWIVRHRMGTTLFERHGSYLAQTLEVGVARTAPVKISVLTLRNDDRRRRRLSIFNYAAWLLGPPRSGHERQVVTDVDETIGAILARNRFRDDPWTERLAFSWSSTPPISYTGDRTEFLGRHGTLQRPRALRTGTLSNHVGARLDPCAVLHVQMTLEPGEVRTLVFLLGEGHDVDEVRTLIASHDSPDKAAAALAETRAWWDRLVGAATIKTPDDSFDLLVNGWLQYQNVSARLFARTGFYQPGGAFGFRDQLQDVMALVHSDPGLCRQHLLLAASRQFTEGDVQHWWHPPSGRGTRTRCSDDLLWLPHAALHYARITGDTALFDESVPFLAGEPLAPDQVERYGPAHSSEESGTLFEHCVRAIDHSLRVGAHGLPLMGSGDWNDGLNQVGVNGQGESVWLGWFLFDVLRSFTSVAERRGRQEIADRYREVSERLRAAIELSWDGDWYRRAYFDDGTPLGSTHSPECQIDSIAQSWAVLSRGAPRQRAEHALDAVRSRLIRRDAQLVLLLAPPFTGAGPDPGYIRAYPPGIRENGGQYTHAALWAVMAIAALGYGDEAVELFHMLNPINHTRDEAGMARYAVEPYVVAADVYAHPQHVGRGGWTWYTASAGVMYRAAIESIVGLRREGSTFSMSPCIPAAWPNFEVRWRVGSGAYLIQVDNPDGVCTGVARAELDGRSVNHAAIPIIDDGQEHRVRLTLARSAGQ